MYAWRRANVAALNHAARAWMDQSGRLHGPEMVCPGGLAYRAGEQVVTLAPGPGGTLVTSERGTVEAVDPAAGALVLRTDDGRTVTLTGGEASAERLGYGYATTVHRSQGATVSRAHLFADGGGRELAYVAMSRARQSTHIWTVADDSAQAGEDLRRDWQDRRSPTWAIDLASPGWDVPAERLDPKQREHRARHIALLAAKASITRRAATGIRAPQLAEAVTAAQADVREALDARADLQRGSGRYQHSDAGRAVRDLEEARAARQQTEDDTRHAPRWRQRRAASTEHALRPEREADALDRYRLHVAPEIARVDRTIANCRAALHQLETRSEQYRQAEAAVAALTDSSSRDVTRLSAHLTVYRNDIDGLPQPAPRPARGLDTQQIRPQAPSVEPPTPQRPELGIGM